MTTKTTSVVISGEQLQLLKAIASIRVLRGEATRASVSDVIRGLIEKAEPDLRREAGQYEK